MTEPTLNIQPNPSIVRSSGSPSLQPAHILPILLMGLGLCTASAHPGHGVSDVPLSHWITSPDHLALLSGLALLLWLGSTRTSRRATKLALRCTSLALWGVSALLLAWTS